MVHNIFAIVCPKQQQDDDWSGIASRCELHLWPDKLDLSGMLWDVHRLDWRLKKLNELYLTVFHGA
jgi:hypothetical protein